MPAHLQTSFVGRHHELDRIDTLLDGGQPLITVWGTAGAGKTRLVLEHSARTDTPVTFCDLSSTTTGDALVAVVAAALGLILRDVTDLDDSLDQVGQHLARVDPTLVVLDNVEQILELTANAISIWMRLAPHVQFVVTSRQRLRLSAEASLELEPLDVPNADADADAIQNSEVVRLFCDRVRMVRPDYEPTKNDVRLVRDIAERLDGLPLAIELAASRFDVLGARGLLDRLDEPMAVLTSNVRDTSARHATLESAIAWSWALLDDDEQKTWAQCAIFCGGFDLDAAEAVVDTPGSTLDQLDALRTKSLITVRPTPDGRTRFWMLTSIRDFGLARLEDQQATAETRVRHARYITTVASEWARESDGPNASEKLECLARERDNLVAVIQHRPTSPHAALAWLALEPVYASRGPLDAFVRLGDSLMSEQVGDPIDASLTIEVLHAHGRACHVLGDVPRARRDFTAALEMACALDAKTAQARLRTDLGRLHHRARELTEALEQYEQALAIQTTEGEVREQGRVLGLIGAVHHDARRFDEAHKLYRRALECFLDAKDERLEGRFLANLGVLEQELGRFDQARAYYDRALIVLRRVRDRRLEAITLGNLGVLEDRSGRREAARLHHEQALTMLRSIGDPRSEALALARLGGVHAQLGAVDQSRTHLAEAEQLAFHVRDPITHGVVDLHRALLEVALADEAWIQGEADRALGYARNARSKVEAAQTVSAGGGHTLVEISDDARSTLAMLERSVVRVEGVREGDEICDGLLLTAGARAVRPPNAGWIDMARRHTLRRILLCLVEQHWRRPRVGLSMDALIAVAWPGEQIVADAASNRLYVALTNLRKLGLRDLVQHGDDGYLLDPKVRVGWAETELGNSKHE